MRGSVLALVLVALLPARAAAATAEVAYADPCAGDAQCEKFVGPGIPVAVYAGGGEADHVTATPTGPHEVTFADALAPMTAGPGCTQVDDRTARCPFSDTTSYPRPVAAVSLTGYGGDDELTIAPGLTQPAALTGGDGDDVLRGGAEADVLDGGIGANTIDGGGGTDTITFAALPAVDVDLSIGHAETAGTGDTLISIENVIGSPYDDRITGDRHRNVLSGGAGNDRIHARDRRRDTVHCGTGRDRAALDHGDHATGCERRSYPR